MKKEVIGESKVLKDLLKMVEKVAPARTNVLIIGESGTGKELIAQLLHEHSPVKRNPFVPVNCGAIPENLIESELFGHKKGAFTGAVSDKMGLFEAANTGTLFLDEVGELPLPLQVKLLRALQERQIRRVGDTKTIPIDVRIVAATNRDLEKASQNGGFREDLYYRLNVIQLRTPPLRERDGDIPILADYFLDRYAKKTGRTFTGFAPEVRQVFARYEWPGNIRELENVIERAATLTQTGTIALDVLPPALRDSMGPVLSATAKQRDGEALTLPPADFEKGSLNLERILDDVERHYLLAALEAAGSVKKQAADLLGITFRSLRYRLDKHGIDIEE